MSATLLHKILINLKNIYVDVTYLIELFRGQFQSNIQLYRKIYMIEIKLKKLNRLHPDDFLFNNTQNILESLNKLYVFVLQLSNLLDLANNKTILDNTQTNMSTTYYNTIMSKYKNIEKQINNLKISIDQLATIVSEELNEDIIIDTPVSTFETLYIDNLSPPNLIIFRKYIDIYKKNNINTTTLYTNIYDYILGYQNEQFNVDPMDKNPILLMGLSFNLAPSNIILTKKEIENTNGAIVIINTPKIYSQKVVYNLHKLIHGPYTTINKLCSISPHTISSSNTILIEPIQQTTTHPQIINNINNSSYITVYQSFDNLVFSLLTPPSQLKIDIQYLDKGPKPRVSLYNDLTFKVINDKKEKI